MSLKIYQVGNHRYQFEEGQQPPNAVEVVGKYKPTFQKKADPVTKAKKPANKSRTVKDK